MTVPTPVLVEHRGPVAIVTLNRPDQLNALAPDQALKASTPRFSAAYPPSATGDAP